MPTRKELADEIEGLAGKLSNTSMTIICQPIVPQIPGFVCSFIRYQATQAYRIAEWLRKEHVDDTDLVAHATRTLFESTLIFGHLLKGGGSHFIDRLVSETMADHFDILRGTVGDESRLSYFPPDLASHYRALKKKQFKRTPSTKELAKECGAETEYKTHYSHMSKYSHPSLYQIAGDYREVYSQHAMIHFASRAVEYLNAIITDSEKIKNIVVEHNENNKC